MLLEVKDLQVSYGAIAALRGVSFSVNEGEIVTLIGANGAGKSTILRTISGLVRPRAGSVHFADGDVTQVQAHKLVAMGISHVPEGRRVFSNLSVYENLRMGAYTQKSKEDVQKGLDRVFTRFPRLKERLHQSAGTLSGGEQQMLAMGRGLMANPRILLLDEPSMGLAPILVQQIFDIIAEINQTGTSILLVEQNANMALSIANRAHVLETGEIVLSGAASELRNDPKIQEAYLGEAKALV
ncbi:MAG: ABC transporter ATP-binding protein [Dehalococcoidales bacterium]|nr:ABC transporter ATP-binding protein [Dehalococcoidales bacterium]